MSDNLRTRYSRILFPSKPPFSSYVINDSNILEPLSLINIFIGANNSGKSRLLRNLFSLREFSYSTNKYNHQPIKEIFQDTKAKFEKIMGKSVSQIGPVSSSSFDASDLDIEFINPNKPVFDFFPEALKLMSNIGDVNNMSGVPGGGSLPDSRTIAPKLRQLGNDTLPKINELINFDKDVGGEKKFYIPILRGMRPLDENQTNLYQTRTIQDYFTKLDDQKEIVFTGIELYQILKQKLLGEPEEREAVRGYEEFLSNKFFQSKQVTLIPREGQNTVHIRIGDEKQLPLYNLGDGLQSLIIVTFNVFMERNQKRCLFFIEEPDLNMHPSFQRLFIDVLSEFDEHQYFITTHSNHLLDMTLDFSDISVFHFRKNLEMEINATPTFNVRLASINDRNILRDLGARNSSLFLSNATIWVEGITDRLYLREYMRKYLDELEKTDPSLFEKYSRLKEDLHYSFFEYQGSTLPHWSFDPNDPSYKRIKADFVCAQAILVADGDIVTKGERYKLYKDMLGDRFEVLPCKEIENLIPEGVLKTVVTTRLDSEDKFKHALTKIDKIKYENYVTSPDGIGNYLDNTLEFSAEQSVFAESSGTIKNKLSFCEQATTLMNDISTDWSLSPQLLDLCRKIFTHIYEQNQ